VARAWKWIAAGLVVAALAAFWLFIRLRDKKTADATLADIVETWSKPTVDRLRQRVADLDAAKDRDEAAVAAARADVEAKRGELDQKFKDLGLTPEEIEARFRGLRI
jgi:hypothetical protein